MTVNNSSTLSTFFGKSILGKHYENDLNMIYVNNIIKYLFTSRYICNYASKDEKSFSYLRKTCTMSSALHSLDILQSIFLVKCDGRLPVLLQREIKKYTSYYPGRNCEDPNLSLCIGLDLKIFSVFFGALYLYDLKDSLPKSLMRALSAYSKMPDKNRIVSLLGYVTSSNIPYDIKIYCALLVYDMLGTDVVKSWQAEVGLFFSDSKSKERDAVLYVGIEERARSLKLYK